jgi:hypothetical protein
MPAKKYFVTLTEEERLTLLQMLGRGKHSARKLTKARILLKADEQLNDQTIANEVQTSQPTVERTRKHFAALRLGALEESPCPGRMPILNEKGEARLIAEACSTAPEGRQRWTLHLLPDPSILKFQRVIPFDKVFTIEVGTSQPQATCRDLPTSLTQGSQPLHQNSCRPSLARNPSPYSTSSSPLLLFQ